MDYIAQLCGEGYTQSRVIRALGITRNDLTMARDILQEFALPSNSEKKSWKNINIIILLEHIKIILYYVVVHVQCGRQEISTTSVSVYYRYT